MRSWLLAWDNLRFNLSKTMLSVLLIALATTALITFRGFENFTAEGLRRGFVAEAGAFQIAHRSFWANDSETPILLKTEDYNIIMDKVNQIDGVTETMSMLSFVGLIGTDKRSTSVVGTAFEFYPQGIYEKVEKESFGPLSEDGIVLGKGLIEYLQVKEDDVLILFGQNTHGETAISPEPMIGAVDLGDRNANKVIGFSSIQNIREFYNYEDEFDRLRVSISDVDDIPAAYKKINELLADTPYEAKDWLYLNPYFTEVETFIGNNALWNSVILIILVVVAIVQMLQMSYLQRMRELGTLQAIGLTPKAVFSLLQKESFLISFMSIILGIGMAFAIRSIIILSGMVFIPPMSTISYPFILVFYTSDIIFISVGIILLTLASSLYPAYRAVSKPVVEVMKNA
ncbi:MAG: ABC transporter permease [Brevinema sp.]